MNKWEKGRSGGGYEKLNLFQGKNWDCWLMRLGEGEWVKPHRDPVDNKNHYRLNILLRKPKSGGVFVCADYMLLLPRITLFRPDLHTHHVTRVDSGKRLVLSFGVAI